MKILPRQFPIHELSGDAQPLYVSDVHLAPEPSEQEDFIDFLNWVQSSDITHIYFLGDLFSTWLGDDHMQLPDYKKVLVSIGDVVQSGKRVILLHGNRDFLAGDAFSRTTGCEVVGDWCLVKYPGLHCLITHGDLFCTNDSSYIKYRRFIRSAPMRTVTNLSPLAMRNWVAHKLRSKSIKDLATKSPQLLQPNQDILNYLLEGTDCIVFGHTHRAEISQPVEGKFLFKLGGWEGSGYLLTGAGSPEQWVLGSWDRDQKRPVPFSSPADGRPSHPPGDNGKPDARS